MAIPFPPTAAKPASLRYTPLYALKNLSPGAEIVWFNQNSLVGMKGSVTSNNGQTMVVSVPALLPSPSLTLSLVPSDNEACLPIFPVV